MFDLPIPLGPGMPVNPGVNGISVTPENDLKFRVRIRLRCIERSPYPQKRLICLRPTRRLSDRCQQKVPTLSALFNPTAAREMSRGRSRSAALSGVKL